MLRGKKILLGITGSIAAYKAAFLCRLFIKEGCEVRVVMTPSARSFVTPLTLSTLSGCAVACDISDGETWTNHVSLGNWADIMVVAPCTASSLAKMAYGQSDNILIACYLSAKCPVVIAPAMDLDMWKHPSVLQNVRLLHSYGNEIINVGYGFLASGLEGEGRMAEPEEIVEYLKKYFKKETELTGKHVLITAGTTYEAIDPVRFIANRSTGKMGYAIAEECLKQGATVTLVSGPVTLRLESPDLQLVKVESAQQMLEACAQRIDAADIVIYAAAVADYRPAVVAAQKIKKSDDSFQLDLVKTTDIAASLSKRRHKGQIIIGFALETNDEIINAKAKLHKKNFDFIVINSLKDEGAGFQHDTNKISIIDSNENLHTYALKSKALVAKDIINHLITIMQKDKNV